MSETHARLSVRTAAADTLLTVMSMILVPQMILRAIAAADNTLELVTASAVSILALVIVHVSLVWVGRISPRRVSYQLISAHVGPTVAVIAASARFLCYVLIVVFGVGLTSAGVQVIAPLPARWVRVIVIALVLLLALPVLARVNVDSRIYWTIASVGVIAVGALVLIGLIRESTGDLDFVSLPPKEGVEITPLSHPRLSASVGALFPAALLFLVSERVVPQGTERRINHVWIGQRMVAVIVIVTLTLYLASLLDIPGQRLGIPTLEMAETLTGEVGATIAGVAYALVGIGAALTAYSRLPLLLRELALDGILPRRLGTEDARRPRLAIVGLTAVFAATLSWVLVSTQAGAVVFVTAAFLQMGLTCLAVALRAVGTLQESLDRDERRQAAAARWVFALLTLGCLGVLVVVAIIAPMLLLLGLVGMAIPSLLMLWMRRRIGRVVRTLQVADLSAGRRLPTRVHGVVLVTVVDDPTLRAVSYARSHRLSSLQAVTVDIDPVLTKRLRRDWQEAGLPVDLTVLGTPRGATRGHIVDFVHSLHEMHPGDIVTVFYPRLITKGVWEGRLIRRNAAAPKVVMDLRHEPGVILAEVPYLIETQEDDE